MKSMIVLYVYILSINRKVIGKMGECA